MIANFSPNFARQPFCGRSNACWRLQGFGHRVWLISPQFVKPYIKSLPDGSRVCRSSGTANRQEAQEWLDHVRADLWRIHRLGARVVGAASGDAILAALGEAGRHPDLIVADYRLADDELGTQVIARLRDEFGVSIPAMLVSGDASVTAIAAMRASSLTVLLKPVVAEELRARAEAMLAAAAPMLRLTPRG